MTWTEVHRKGIDLLPEHMREAVVAYVEEGRPISSFLMAIFSNDLIEAFRRADDTNERAMKAWARFLDDTAPYGCWGSSEMVMEWMRHAGLKKETP